MKYKVVEVFSSINGEGRFAGELSVFVRFAGCNLKCNYCDTSWANQEDTSFSWMDEDEIADRIQATGIRRVTLTGGEPLLQPGIRDLLIKLTGFSELQIEIETNGSVDIVPFQGLSDRITFTLDYKLPGSGMEESMLDSNYQAVTGQDTVKFVISHRSDLERAETVIRNYGLCDRCHVYLSPVYGRIGAADIVEYMKEHGMNHVRLQLQLHKYIWDKDARGV
ncbi:MAG: putative 7-carboxy-7-deazaguanine synthase QueE [Lachnospiraceae bacterium]|nr:putative 7-carboxy-7-deazaguanine synthase QueE [Lachnospiraceae bacterium]